MTGSPARLYGLHGLRVRSTVALAGFPLPGDDYDLAVQFGPSAPVPPDCPAGRPVLAGGPPGYRYVAADDGTRLTLRLPGVSDFLIDKALWAVECRRDPGADPRLVAALLGGLVISVVLNLGGHCVLHASAVEVEGRAVAFAGARGAGKSTLAALLCGAGARLVTDDVLRVGTDPAPVCVGGTPQLRLRSGADWALQGFDAPPPSQATVDFRLAIMPPVTEVARVPLSVIVLPCVRRDAQGVELRPLSGAEALARMVGGVRVPGWTDPEMMRGQFRALSRTASAVPVVEAVLPWGPESRSSIAPALLELLHDHG